MNLPNLLTALRMALIPVFVLVYGRGLTALALLIFLAASLTDCLDGYLARKWNQVTPFGKLFDPMADKLLLLSVLFCLARNGDIPWWMVAVMGAKERSCCWEARGFCGARWSCRPTAWARRPRRCSSFR